jgi:hypothetical protein
MEVREYLKRIGRQGGKIGGRIAAERMTPEERKARAKKAARAATKVRRAKARARRAAAEGAKGA